MKADQPDSVVAAEPTDDQEDLRRLEAAVAYCSDLKETLQRAGDELEARLAAERPPQEVPSVLLIAEAEARAELDRAKTELAEVELQKEEEATHLREQIVLLDRQLVEIRERVQQEEDSGEQGRG